MGVSLDNGSTVMNFSKYDEPFLFKCLQKIGTEITLQNNVSYIQLSLFTYCQNTISGKFLLLNSEFCSLSHLRGTSQFFEVCKIAPLAINCEHFLSQAS